MPISPDFIPPGLLAEARAALLEWYGKKIKKPLEGPELEEKVREVMAVQFPGTQTNDDAWPTR